MESESTTEGPLELERASAANYLENTEPPRVHVSGSDFGLDDLSERSNGSGDDMWLFILAATLIGLGIIGIASYFDVSEGPVPIRPGIEHPDNSTSDHEED